MIRFYGYRLKFWLFYGYWLFFFSVTVNKKLKINFLSFKELNIKYYILNISIPFLILFYAYECQ